MCVHKTLSKYILVDGFSHVVDLEKSEGSWFVDAQTGKKYLDCYSMHAAMPLGWNYPKYVERGEEIKSIALYNPANSDCYTKNYADFVETFAGITSDFSHYFFVAGGTLAVENALKASFDWQSQRLGLSDRDANLLDVIHLTMAFHGRSGYTLSLTNTGDIKTKWYPKWDWTRVNSPATNIYHDEVDIAEADSLSIIENTLKHKLVAAIILEPIQSEGGDNHFRKEFLAELRRLADENGVMLIFDEIQTGMGMTGKMWCYEHFGVIPDMITFGKKTQVCGFCSTDRIDAIADNVFQVSGRINSTWGGNLVDMVRAKVYIDIIKEDNLVENAKEVGEYFLTKLNELGLDNVRGKGLIIAFDLATTEERDNFFGKLSESVLCLKCGPKSIRFRPHLTFDKEAVDVVVDAIKAY